jgi:hypothetical protein
MKYPETMRVTKELLEKAGLDPARINDPVFMSVLQDALEIQDRFSAEPVYAKTGKGFLRSVGVEEVAKAKKLNPAKPQRDSAR